MIVEGSDGDDGDGRVPGRLGCSAGTASTWDGLLLRVYCSAAGCAEGAGLWTRSPLAPPYDSWLLI